MTWATAGIIPLASPPQPAFAPPFSVFDKRAEKELRGAFCPLLPPQPRPHNPARSSGWLLLNLSLTLVVPIDLFAVLLQQRGEANLIAAFLLRQDARAPFPESAESSLPPRAIPQEPFFCTCQDHGVNTRSASPSASRSTKGNQPHLPRDIPQPPTSAAQNREERLGSCPNS